MGDSVMRAGVVTLSGNTNYGNRLQSFALQRALGSLGAQAENILIQPTLRYRLQRVDLAMKALRSDGVGFLRKKLGGEVVHARGSSMTLGERMLADFTAHHLLSRRGVIRGELGWAGVGSEYEMFIVGSDQVWNPLYTHGDPNYFLQFAPFEKRIAYAASFGVTSVPFYMRAGYRTMIDGIPHVSVREPAAQELVFRLSGREVPVVLDPTMLLERRDWESCIAAIDLKSEGYLAAFFLDPDTGARVAEDVRALGTQLGREVKRIADPLGRVSDPVTPFEFVSLIANAGAVVTDSFHAAVFSIIFNKPLFTVKRGGMYSRLQGLAELAGLGSTELEHTQFGARSGEVDWDAVNRRIGTLREDSLGFLREAIASASGL